MNVSCLCALSGPQLTSTSELPTDCSRSRPKLGSIRGGFDHAASRLNRAIGYFGIGEQGDFQFEEPTRLRQNMYLALTLYLTKVLDIDCISLQKLRRPSATPHCSVFSDLSSVNRRIPHAGSTSSRLRMATASLSI